MLGPSLPPLVAELKVAGGGEPEQQGSVLKSIERARFTSIWVLVPTCAILSVLYVFPLLRTVGLSFGGSQFTLSYYGQFFTSSVYVRVLAITVGVSLVVTCLVLVLAFPVSYVLARTRPRVRSFLLLLVLVPWLVTELVRNYAWVVILHPTGVLAGLPGQPPLESGTLAAAIVGMVYVQLPLGILPLYAVLQRVDLSLLQVSQSLGATPLKSVQLILIPLSFPGLAASAVMVFLTTLAFYVAPQILGGPRDLFMANLIDIQVTQLVNWEYGSALSMVLVASALIVVLLAKRLIGLAWLTSGTAAAAIDSDMKVERVTDRPGEASLPGRHGAT